ncbi:NirD/YgiW/YdeI family stress tolerance protein [Brucella tritici]|uniref:NirD/YgiW/YdeI family stress tolerance protein n=1 Tax=Brucella tritici TaxID=94626 RepID=A0A7V7VX95_9HYPH|nr:NirD/YgiW/YdeI family stress tolerance protein [Brucella tritici]KAB2658824.1 NirD/YgiW/YdeI family stress tolerance protein [Brucella tritici]
MASVKQHMIQFALILGLFSLGFVDVSHAQFLDSFKARNTITADAITRTPVGTRVVLTGTIKSNVRRAQYVFQDHTGRTRVRIEREVWRGREINTKNKIEIRGRVENDVRGRFIDVNYFKIVN